MISDVLARSMARMLCLVLVILHTEVSHAKPYSGHTGIPVEGDGAPGLYSFESDGRKYDVYFDKVTWDEALDLCKSETSFLARIQDLSTQDALANFLKSDELSTGKFWIDASDVGDEGAWKDSVGNQLTFSAWAANEPNNGIPGNISENCAYLSSGDDYLWNDDRCDSHNYFICQSGSTSRCYSLLDGYDYTGMVSMTEGGLECQYWSEQYPHRHANYRPYPSLSGHNYCRNPPGSSRDRPWCYTTDPDTRWQYCDVGVPRWPCDSDDTECYTEHDGSDYRGRVSVTNSGKACQRWNEQRPHEHVYRGDDYVGEHNYCRNPSHSIKPWCYTTNPGVRWQYCDVCPEALALKSAAARNIALTKEAYQSSLLTTSGVASNAVDGFKSPYWGDGSCSHTKRQRDPWWKVDLGVPYFVDRVVITNRADCCPTRLTGAVVRVGSSHSVQSNSGCGETVNPYRAAESTTLTFDCGAVRSIGRFVSVQLENQYQFLTLCEVEVLGTRAELWRADNRCGPQHLTSSNVTAECNPDGENPCCSPSGWCGRSADHCACPGCRDFRKIYQLDAAYVTEGGVNIALNKKASQSSVYNAWAPSHAVDGFKSTLVKDNSCSHTSKEDDPWWMVDLEYPHVVTDVVITNRRDCCSTRLEGAVVRVGSSYIIRRNDQCSQTVTRYQARESTTITFDCKAGTVGRFVSVQLEGKHEFLTLCEVVVHGEHAKLWRYDRRCGPKYPTVSNIPTECNPLGKHPCCSPSGWCGMSVEHCRCSDCLDYRKIHDLSPRELQVPTGDSNLALNKPASQSSLLNTVGVAAHAVDGFTSGNYIDHSCTHTLREEDPWWKVDLGDSYVIDRVVITNRQDCCSKRLRGAVVRVGSRPDFRRNHRCAGALGWSDVTTSRISVECGGVRGRYVSVQLEGHYQFLTLCEIEVYEVEDVRTKESNMECRHVYSDRSNGLYHAVPHVRCEEGWIMTECSVFTFSGMTDGAQINDDGVCEAANDNRAGMATNALNLWVVATCCRDE